MDIKINEVSQSEQELEVTLTYDEIKDEIDDAYKKERKTIAIDGFRKGKAPIAIIKKLYGDSIEYKASESISNKKFWDVVDSENLKPISTPQLMDIDFVKDEKLFFKVRYEIKPELDVKDYKNLEIEKPIFKVKDEDIDNEVNKILKSQATFEDAEKVEDSNHRITANLQRLKEDGSEYENSRSENIVIDLSEPAVNEEIKKNSLNKGIGDQFKFTFVDEHKHGEETHSEEYIYNSDITKIEKIVLPETNEELVKKISNDKATSLEQFKDQIKDNYEQYYVSQSEQIFQSSLLNEVVKNNEFEVPKGYVSFILNRLINSEKENAKQYGKPVPDDETLKKELATRAEWSAKWQIVMENIGRVESIEVNDSDLEKLAEEEAEKTGISVKKMMKYYGDTNRKEALLEDKVIKFLTDHTKIKEVDPEKAAKKAKSSDTKKSTKKSTPKKEGKKEK
ncbi:MAG: trigger factor [Bacteroidota bacterium]